jgi:hypothetical protein
MTTRFRSTLRRLVLALLVSFAGTAAHAALVDVVEFYNASFDHYFVTASPDEITKLDTGFFVGWQRTGQSFKGLDSADMSPGAVPVCRFYGLPSAGLDSHFYSASTAECDAVKQKFAQSWLFESPNVFEMYLPNTTTGACPANTVPVYRLWNNRVDSNHRYTTSIATFDAMVAKGYIAEGYGAPARPVAMCSPQPASLQPPACTLGASSTTANVGTSVLLTANCTGTPTSYAWTACASAGPACTATSSAAGTVTYTVIASNANGAGAPASVQVAWSSPPPPPPPELAPVCSLVVTAPNPTPTVGTLAAIESSCSSSPTAYNWTNCSTLTDVCRVRGSVTGLQTYTVTASNSGGTSPPASANVNWVGADATPVGLCGQVPVALYSEVGSTNVTVHSLYAESPGFAWNGVWAVHFTVPSTANTAQSGFAVVAEYGGPSTYREITISPTACDFRPTDATGAAGPLGRAASTSAILSFGIGQPGAGGVKLAPGASYWLNVRNYYPDTATITCPPSPGRCDASAQVIVPR